MAKTHDWWPSSRAGRLLRVKNWITYLGEKIIDEKGQTVWRYASWGISQGLYEELVEVYETALQSLLRIQNEDTRTRPAIVACKDAFIALESCARSLKRQFFHAPPRTKEEIAVLGFSEPAWGAGPRGNPSAEIKAEPSIRGLGYHQIRFKIEVVSGDLNARNNQGHFHTKYGLAGPDDPPPESYKDLHEDIYSDQVKDFINLEPEDSGKTIYFCSRIEQGKRKGPWGPITSARVP